MNGCRPRSNVNRARRPRASRTVAKSVVRGPHNHNHANVIMLQRETRRSPRGPQCRTMIGRAAGRFAMALSIKRTRYMNFLEPPAAAAAFFRFPACSLGRGLPRSLPYAHLVAARPRRSSGRAASAQSVVPLQGTRAYANELFTARRAGPVANCPGVTTPAMCGEEPHSDPGGEAVAWGLSHRTASAAECCERCATHAADPKNAKKPCNSWVFCYLPLCWSLDTGHKHSFGECWLKWQIDATHPLYGQRGRYSDEFRKRHWRAHLTGGRNLSMPSHVPWTGGVMGTRVDLSVRWETGPEGMTSSKGDEIVNWRAWEEPGAYEKRVAAKQRAGGSKAKSAKNAN
eukprot:scaffold58501_cov33-Tisochrysis_lutea.AAC.1